jgi:hypothetical protein
MTSLRALLDLNFEIKSAYALRDLNVVTHYIYVQKGGDAFLCTIVASQNGSKEMPPVRLA